MFSAAVLLFISSSYLLIIAREIESVCFFWLWLLLATRHRWPQTNERSKNRPAMSEIYGQATALCLSRRALAPAISNALLKKACKEGSYLCLN